MKFIKGSVIQEYSLLDLSKYNCSYYGLSNQSLNHHHHQRRFPFIVGICSAVTYQEKGMFILCPLTKCDGLLLHTRYNHFPF